MSHSFGRMFADHSWSLHSLWDTSIRARMTDPLALWEQSHAKILVINFGFALRPSGLRFGQPSSRPHARKISLLRSDSIHSHPRDGIVRGEQLLRDEFILFRMINAQQFRIVKDLTNSLGLIRVISALVRMETITCVKASAVPRHPAIGTSHSMGWCQPGHDSHLVMRKWKFRLI